MADNFSYGTTGKPHPYHIVRPSPWPLLASFAAGLLCLGLVLYMHGVELYGFNVGFKGIILGLASVIAVAFFWWKDVVFESVKEKSHNKITEIGMRYGMALFIASEVMFFAAFFWAFFASALFPNEGIGGTWPPADISVIPAFDLPFLMTMLLLLSGCCVTWAHHAIMENNVKDAALGTILGVGIAVIFMGFQVYEYVYAPFGFKDTVYASTFFMATGFHGLHVLIGGIFLFVCWVRFLKGHFTKDSHFGFEAAAWYWHFVDVVWLILFVAIYWWGNAGGTVAAH